MIVPASSLFARIVSAVCLLPYENPQTSVSERYDLALVTMAVSIRNYGS